MEASDLTSVDLTKAMWKKSSRSGENGGNCVEVATLTHRVAIRDSKDPARGHLTVSAEAFGAFLATIKD